VTPPSRRHLLTSLAAGVGGAAAALGLAVTSAADATAGAAGAAAPTGAPTTTGPAPAGVGADVGADADAVHGLRTVPFHGAHQAGIETPAQAHATFVGLDLRAGTDRAALVRVLRLLSDDAARLTQGHPALGDTEPELAAAPARLTVTFGFGPGLFTRAGLDARRPASVARLEAFAGERLEDRWSAGDLLLQVCSDDPVTVAHTVRMLVKDARRFATVRWVQRGFRTAWGTAPEGTTARNLLGQVDGTVQPLPGTAFDGAVWARDPDWFRGGSMLVLRRVRTDLETWDAFDRGGKELVMGRRLDTGAPLTGKVEHDLPDLTAVGPDGLLVIDDLAHVRLAHATSPAERMLRRAYNYDEGPGADGTADVGLLFAAYQADAGTAFVPVQRRLAAKDALNKWITHIGSAVFALPPGAAEGGFVGEPLLAG